MCMSKTQNKFLIKSYMKEKVSFNFADGVERRNFTSF